MLQLRYLYILIFVLNTIFINAQDIYIANDSINKNRTTNFYDSLRIKAGDKKYSNSLYKLIFKSPSKPYKSVTNNETLNNYNLLENKGKIIKEIQIINFSYFEKNSIYPLNKLNDFYTKALNFTHIKTNKKVILGYLTFKKGETVKPEIINDSEVLLRSLDFIRDAKIVIVPDSLNINTATVKIYIQDQWSKAIGAELDNLYSGYVSVLDKNIAGTGQRFETRMFFNNRYQPIIGPGLYLKLRNLYKTLINIDLSYKNTNLAGDKKFDIYRRFYTPEIKYAGGFTMLKSYRYNNIDLIDTTLTNIFTNYEIQDLWLSKAFILRKEQKNKVNRTRLILSARATNYYYFNRPQVTKLSLYQYHNHHIIFGSLALTKPKYYKTNMVYYFGKTEDIPYGHYIDIQFGKDYSEYYIRDYYGINIAKGYKFEKLGYINAFAGFGGYTYQKELQQAILKSNIDFFSNLFTINNYYLREFIKLRYTSGINRFMYETINLNNKNGIRGLNSNEMKGKKKLAINIESVVFSPLYFYGFRFVFFAFSDFGFISFNNNLLKSEKLYSGFGLGVRLRNEFLVFETFQLRFSLYPKIPLDANPSWIIISDEAYRNPASFRFEEPTLLRYE